LAEALGYKPEARVRFPITSLGFIIEFILSVAQPLAEMSTSDVSWWVKPVGD
jgi:hypothetical protein